jgi:hypothetical protein
MSYFVAGFFGVCGVTMYVWFSEGLLGRKMIVLALGAIGVIFAVICACCFSDAEFMFWKVRTTSPAMWEQMADDLRGVGKKVIDQDATGLGNFRHLKMPQSFEHLGLEGEFDGGNAGCGTNPYVWYGRTKGRRWGIVIGSNYFSHGNWALSKRVQVATNVYFFAGPNY